MLRSSILAVSAALSTLALLRSARTGLGFTERGALEAAGAAALAFALGVRQRSAVPRALPWVGAAVACAAMALLGRFPSQLERVVLGLGEGWRQDSTRSAFALAFLGFPFYTAGRLAAHARAGVAPWALTGLVVARVVLDAPPVAPELGAALAWVSPFVAAAAVRWQRPNPAELRSPEPALQDGNGRGGIGATAQDILVVGAAALAILVFRVELRSFVRGTAWDLALVDIAIAILAVAGHRFLGPAVKRADGGAIPAAAALVALGIVLASRRLSLLAASPEDFRRFLALLETGSWGVASVDRSLYPAAIALASLPVLGIALGGVLAALERERLGGRAGAPLGVLMALVVGLTAGEGADPAGGHVAKAGLLGLLTIAAWGLAAASAFASVCLLQGSSRKRPSILLSAVLSISTAAVALAAPFAEFRPASLFSTQERGVPEVHVLNETFESLEGIATVVEVPDWRAGAVPMRTTRVRMDRVDRTPFADGEVAWAHALAAALLFHGAPRRILVIGELSQSQSSLLAIFGAAEIAFASVPRVLGELRAFGDLPRARRTTAPLGERGFDLVYVPPHPKFQAAPAWTVEPEFCASLLTTLAPGGVLAVDNPLASTPPEALTRLRHGMQQHGSVALSFASNGLFAPVAGLLVRVGSAGAISGGPGTGVDGANAKGGRDRLRDVPELRDDPLGNPRGTPLPLRRPSAGSGGRAFFRSLLPTLSTHRDFEACGRGHRFSPDGRILASRGASWFLENLADCEWAEGPREQQALWRAETLFVRLVQEFHAGSWRFNPFRRPIEQTPLPESVTEGLIAAAGSPEAPWPRFQIAAHQALEILEAQKAFGRLHTVAQSLLGSHPEDWVVRCKLSRAHRELLDVDGAAALLAEAPLPSDLEGRTSISVERAYVELQRGNPELARSVLRQSLTAAPNSTATLEALVEAELALGNLEEARVAARLHATISPDEGASERLFRRIDLASGQSSKPSRDR